MLKGPSVCRVKCNSSVIDRRIVKLKVTVVEFIPGKVDINSGVLRVWKQTSNSLPRLETFKEELECDCIVQYASKSLYIATSALSRDTIALEG